MKIAALLTARNGSKSVINKNLYIYNNMPLYEWNVRYTEKSIYIKKIYISTDIPSIIQAYEDQTFSKKVELIVRPEYLCTDDSSHYDTIIHGFNIIEEDIGKIDYLVVLLGNAPWAFTKDVDSAISLLDGAGDKFDSCQSVSKFNHFNPFRSFRITKETGELTPIIDHNMMSFLQKKNNINDKHAFGNTYYFNGGFWIIKRHTLLKNNGNSVFSWLGQSIMPYIQEEGLQEIDAPYQLKYLT